MKDYITGRGQERAEIGSQMSEGQGQIADLSKRFDMTLAAVSYTVKKGKKIAKEAGCHLDN